MTVGPITTQFAYDGTDLIADYNGGGTLQHRYVFGPGEDDPIVEYAGSGTTSRTFLSADEHGSIIARSDNTGALVAANTYDEYGIPGSSNRGLFQYTGQVYLPQIGMYDYKARMYSPTLGRFPQTDPTGYADGPNWYAYAHDDPVDGKDSTGELAVTCEFNGDINKGTCYYRDDGNDNTVTVKETYLKTVDGNTVANASTNTYSAEAISNSQFWGGGGVESILSEQAHSAFGITLSFSNSVTMESHYEFSGVLGALMSPRASLLSGAQDRRVRDVVNQLYRPSAKIGNGSAMDAYRADGSHEQKLLERRTQLRRLIADPTLSPSDRRIVRDLLIDIDKALDGR